ncbi:DNA polymerase [Brevibacillus laterosporus]|uniref:DNA polymerase n=1 Tax=Brevibacillus laterosporus TaxID=1465 RepID=UPI00265098AA|nr:DNA polymerase [Brevibacillus laterosporus]MDN9010035.1 DNA polymerase [Brevibacillus laterosporus]MDO0940583.1 DNA polymerase [Brevibacillus laterosporus]
MADATKRKSAATETIEQAWARVGAQKLTDKERVIYETAKTAFFSGAIGRLSEKKLSKAEVLEMGRRIMAAQATEAREERIAEVLAGKPDNYFILTDDCELPAFVERLREEVRRQRVEWRDRFRILDVDSMTAGDFEGTGIDSYIDLSIGFSIWLPILNEGYYLPYGHVDGFDVPHAFKAGDPQLTRSKVLAAITPYLSRPEHGKTFHMGSARYDLHIAQNDGYEIHGCVWDTLDAMHLMNEHEESYGLKPLTAKYGRFYGIDGPIYTFDDMFGNRSPAPFNTELVGIYAIKDVLYGWKLFEWQFEVMAKTGRLLECYANIDSKLPETDVFMARCGFEIDLVMMRGLSVEFEEKLTEARRQLVETYGIDIEFVRKMDRTINAKKVADWIETQKKRITKRDENIAKQQAIIADLESRGKSHLKRYSAAKQQLAKYLAEDLVPADEKHAPLFVEDGEFKLTNGNHIAYLIYDHIGIRDRTHLVKRGKTRSTAADVLEMYYEDEEELAPLATVAAYEKLLSTYVNKIPNALEPDGRLHSEFKAGGTKTGRYSSSGYNGRPIDILDEFKTGV